MTEKLNMTMYQSVVKRFLKGLISGAVTSMSLVTLTQPTIWSDFKSIFTVLGVAGLFGAINGLLLAIQKWSSWED